MNLVIYKLDPKIFFKALSSIVKGVNYDNDFRKSHNFWRQDLQRPFPMLSSVNRWDSNLLFKVMKR